RVAGPRMAGLRIAGDSVPAPGFRACARTKTRPEDRIARSVDPGARLDQHSGRHFGPRTRASGRWGSAVDVERLAAHVARLRGGEEHVCGGEFGRLPGSAEWSRVTELR